MHAWLHGLSFFSIYIIVSLLYVWGGDGIEVCCYVLDHVIGHQILCSNTVQHAFHTIYPSLCINALSLNPPLADQLSSLSSFTISLKFHLAPAPHFKQRDDC